MAWAQKQMAWAQQPTVWALAAAQAGLFAAFALAAAAFGLFAAASARLRRRRGTERQQAGAERQQIGAVAMAQTALAVAHVIGVIALCVYDARWIGGGAASPADDDAETAALRRAVHAACRDWSTAYYLVDAALIVACPSLRDQYGFLLHHAAACGAMAVNLRAFSPAVRRRYMFHLELSNLFLSPWFLARKHRARHTAAQRAHDALLPAVLATYVPLRSLHTARWTAELLRELWAHGRDRLGGGATGAAAAAALAAAHLFIQALSWWYSYVLVGIARRRAIALRLQPTSSSSLLAALAAPRSLVAGATAVAVVAGGYAVLETVMYR